MGIKWICPKWGLYHFFVHFSVLPRGSCGAIEPNGKKGLESVEPLFVAQDEAQALKGAGRERVLHGLHNGHGTGLYACQGGIYLQVVDLVSMDAIHLCSCQACSSVSPCPLPCFKQLKRTVDTNEEDGNVSKQGDALPQPLAFQQDVVNDEMVPSQSARCNSMMISRDQPLGDWCQIDGERRVAMRG